VKVDEKPVVNTPTAGEGSNSGENIPAHLAFRQIVVHEFSDEQEPHPVRFNFHYREHSKHLLRRGAA
jgi:hypothetical protein